MTNMREFVDKDIKTGILTALHMFKKPEEPLSIVSRDVEDIKKTQMEFLVIKATTPEMKTALNGVHGRLDIAEEKVRQPEDVTIEAIQKETQRERKTEKT